jgi:nuclear transcription factor Y alpha
MYQPQYGVPQQGMQQVPYGMPGIQAAAMAATAAASGSNYPYMQDPNMPQTSPRMSGAGAKKDGRQSPRMNNVSQISGRRLSQVTSPGGVPGAQSMMSHAGPRPGVAPPQMPPASAMQHPQSPEMTHGVEESPLYVNAKQFHRILKRRVARQRLEEQLRLTSKGRKPYLHESRHNHAMRRPRGPGGRFLTAEEVAAMEREGKTGEDGGQADAASTSTTTVSSSGATKRKSEAGGEPLAKKSKPENGFADEDDEEEDESWDDETKIETLVLSTGDCAVWQTEGIRICASPPMDDGKKAWTFDVPEFSDSVYSANTLFVWNFFGDGVLWIGSLLFPSSFSVFVFWPLLFYKSHHSASACVLDIVNLSVGSAGLFAGDYNPFPTLYYSAWTGNSITCASSNIFIVEVITLNGQIARMDDLTRWIPPTLSPFFTPFSKTNLGRRSFVLLPQSQFKLL